MISQTLTPGRYTMTDAAGRTMAVTVRYLGRRLVVIPPSGYPQEPETFGPDYRFTPLEG
jgi:hypothetical protein